MSSPGLPWAVVLSCKGAPEGALNAVRALGREGIPVAVMSEARRTPASVSRYCRQHLWLGGAGFASDPLSAFEALANFARRAHSRPVLFPTADPDLAFVAQYHERLRSVGFRLPTPSPELVVELLDKSRFATLAERQRWPVPKSVSLTGPSGTAACEAVRGLRLPLVFKPAHPGAWGRQAVRELFGDEPLKAHRVTHYDEALSLCARLAALGAATLVQEYVPGPDSEHYDLHVYVSRQGTPLGWFCGRKWRIYPAHAGSGCYVRPCECAELAELGFAILRDIGYSGIANMNFKRDVRNGAFWLLEINARLSQWNLFAADCGVNLPALAYADHGGQRRAQRTARVEPRAGGREYLHFRHDRLAWRQYRRSGQWPLREYLASLRPFGKTYQYWARDDWRPYWFELSQRFAQRLGRVCVC